MTTYVVLISGEETAWEARTEAQRSATHEAHRTFARTLAERGHKITAGEELTGSRDGKVVRPDGDGFTVTDGPYAETVEQLGGFYVVESDDLDDLMQVVGELARTEGAVEVRGIVDHSGDMG
jgi:hypothetical protein